MKHKVSSFLYLRDVSVLLLLLCYLPNTGAVSVSKNITAIACERSELTLDCRDKGGIIRIIRANYGRFTFSLCNPRQVNKGWNVQCTATNSTKVVSERCNDQVTCEVLASGHLFGDPCVGTGKYIEVKYFCLGKVVHGAMMFNPAHLANLTYSHQVLACDGQASCMIMASNSVFGDPCLQTFKYLQIDYYCEIKVTSERPTTSKPTTSKPSTEAVISKAASTTTTTTTTTTSSATVTTESAKTTQKPEVVTLTSNPRTISPTPQKYCHEVRDETIGVQWRITPVGQTAERPCPDNKKGMVTWTCGVSGWIGEPDTTNCVSLWVHNVDQMIEGNDATKTATYLRDQTSSKKMGAGDLKMTTEVLFPKLNTALKNQLNSSTSPQDKNQKIKNFTDAITATGSNLLSEDQSVSWKELSASERSKVASSLVVSMEETGFTIAANVEINQTVLSADVNLLLQVSVRDVSKQNTGEIRLPAETSGNWTADKVTIPVESLRTGDNKGVARIVFLVYNNLQKWMQPSSADNQIEKDDVNTTTEETQAKGPYIVSNIFSASINSRKEKFDLPKPIEFTMRHKKRVEEGYEAVCSYWEMDDRSGGEWSDSGCWMSASNATHTTCRCNHLTNFAVLMDVAGTEIPRVHEITLMAITYVGCIISIICLILSLFTFSFFKNLQCDRNTIHKNLVFCLMLAEIVFIVGISLTQNKYVCAVIAGLLHFLFLASFSWMCLEGVQLYVMLIEVFEAERSRKKWYYLVGYGIPIVIVAVAAGVQPTGYGTERHCWLRTDTFFIWSFVGPVIAVLAVNVVMLSIAVYMMCKHANTLASSLRTKEKSRIQKINQDPNTGSSSASTTMLDEKTRTTVEIPAWIKGAVVLVVLLGLTWGFGFMFVSQETLAMAYIFTTLNTLQGLFIFVFHCLMNEKVKKEYKKLAYRSTWLPNCLRNICVGFSGSISYSPHNSTSSGGNLLKFWSGKRRRKSSGSTLDKSSYKGQKRRSDPRSDSEFFTSRDTNSVFSNGTGKRNSHSTSNGTSNGHAKKSYHETDGIIGDLSIMDCSVIDSEYVTEYCQNNMNVSTENKRYSSGSEDVVDALDDAHDKNRLSILSEVSAIKNHSDFASTEAELNYGSHTDCSGDESERPSSVGYTETEPLMEKTQSEKNLFNYLMNQNGNRKLDTGEEKLYPGSVTEIYLYQNCLSSGEDLNSSTPNLKFNIEAPTKGPVDDDANSSYISSLPELVIVEEGDLGHSHNLSHSLDLQNAKNVNGKKVKRLSSDCHARPDLYGYSQESSEC